MLLQREGRIAEAVASYEDALRINPASAETLHNLGCALLVLERIDAATDVLQRAYALRPDYAPTLDALGFATAKLGDPEAAIALFERSLALDAGSPAVHGRLGNVLLLMQRYSQACTRFASGLRIAPDDAELLDGLGCALQRMEQTEEAVTVFRRAVTCDPQNANAWHNLGKTLLEIGDIGAAMPCFERAVALEPRNGSYYLPLVAGGTAPLERAQLDGMRSLGAAIETLPLEQQIDLHFALGNADERDGNVDAAFARYQTANALKRATIAYDESAALAYVRAATAAFGPELMDQLRGCGNPSARPVFIVGMPRSGSTLVEQFVAAHPAITGLGEIGAFGAIARADWPTLAAGTGGDRCAGLWRIGERYLAAIRARVPEHGRFTDKTLENVQFIPLIHAALPNARIIHVRRDDLDTCFSSFATNFADHKVPFSYDLGELGRYQRAYRRMIAAWSGLVPPDRLLEVRYEQLVATFEAEARRVIAFCDLAWDDACLRFDEARRIVRTASYVQVRRPLYSSSVGRASVFRKHLGPLTAILSS